MTILILPCSLPRCRLQHSEGFYVKTRLITISTRMLTGKINLDLPSKLGLGDGFAHNYRSRLLGSGRLGCTIFPLQSKASSPPI